METARQQSNRESSIGMLRRHGVQFVKQDQHLQIKHGPWSVNFWPQTGQWIAKGTGRMKARGIINLLRFLGTELD